MKKPPSADADEDSTSMVIGKKSAPSPFNTPEEGKLSLP
jgi:hypothetical protein